MFTDTFSFNIMLMILPLAFMKSLDLEGALSMHVFTHFISYLLQNLLANLFEPKTPFNNPKLYEK